MSIYKVLIFSSVLWVASAGSSRAEVSDKELSAHFDWEIEGPKGYVTWVQIRGEDGAELSGTMHVSILQRKKSAHLWEFRYLCPHLAITAEALRRSVVKPVNYGGTYPERFIEAYEEWKQDKAAGHAYICTTSIADYLKQREPARSSGTHSD